MRRAQENRPPAAGSPNAERPVEASYGAQSVESPAEGPSGALAGLIRFALYNKFLVFSVFGLLLLAGIYFAPFDWNFGNLPRNPVPVDAIPDIGENQQIVFTEWEGRSPQDIEDQITYPLTVSLMGMPGVRTVRSISMFGFSTIYVIFHDDVDFYWSRTRILEKLNSLAADILPEGVRPALGPDSTALGQVFWYTLEGLDPDGRPTGGWDLDELRSVQDWNVRYALLAVEGVSEVASVGGFVREYQVDADPDAMRAYQVSLAELSDAIRMANSDIGARTMEINNVEYLIRGVGYVKKISDIEESVIKSTNGVPVYVKNVAHVSFGPAPREGLLDKEGAEAVGGVVTVRYGENPLAVIKGVKAEIERISGSLPEKVLADGTKSRLAVVPFYDRTGLIYETLGTLNSALLQQILITVIVIVVMLRHLRVSMMISLLLPTSVLLSFVLMKLFGVDANVIALGGIAIAIGVISDIGIVICENTVKRLREAPPGTPAIVTIHRAVSEVAGAVLTSTLTTIVSFLPVFTLQYSEGKLFRPLAFTKTFTMSASLLIALLVLPPMLHLFLAPRGGRKRVSTVFYLGLAAACIWLAAGQGMPFGWILLPFPLYWLLRGMLPAALDRQVLRLGYVFAALLCLWLLARHWAPLGADAGLDRNLLFAALLLALFLGLFQLVELSYGRIMKFLLRFKVIGFALPLLLLLIGLMSWLGFEGLFGRMLREDRTRSRFEVRMNHLFPGLGKEFIPNLNEGSFLFMPTVMPHAGIGEVRDVLAKQDTAIASIPEVSSAVGKAGRAESPLDPAPLSMIETVINYHNEFLTDAGGRLLTFRHDPAGMETYKDVAGREVAAADGEAYFVKGEFLRDAAGQLIPDPRGKVFRQWRPALDPALNPGRVAWPGIRSADDIWQQIVHMAAVPGATSAPQLQPIQTRIVMLQTGMRAPMGLIVRGPDLDSIERASELLGQALQKVPVVDPEMVIVDRTAGKPYIEIVIDRNAIARHGIMLGAVQETIEAAVGGMTLTTSVENRERYAIRLRYQREHRDDLEALRRILVDSGHGVPVPLEQLAAFEIVRGPHEIKAENSFKVGYVFFDRIPGIAESDAVERTAAALEAMTGAGELTLPAGVSYRFAGNYENQVRASQRLAVIIPLVLALIFLLIYMQFKSLPVTLMIFAGIAVAWAGGFTMLWLYNTPWFMNFSLFGVNMRELFHIGPINLGVTVWVGFLALFGIATDDAVVMATYIKSRFDGEPPGDTAELRANIVSAGQRRIRACLMTTATTIVAFLPVLTSNGKGAEIMIPMAVPVFGGMIFEVITMLLLPLLYAVMEEAKLRYRNRLVSRS